MENASAPLFMRKLTLDRCEILVWAGVRDLPGAEETDTLEAPLGKKSLVVINQPLDHSSGQALENIIPISGSFFQISYSGFPFQF